MKIKFILALAVLTALVAADDRQIISAPMTVEAGDTLRFAPGTVVLFNGYSGITVKGRLEAIGSKDKPIKFVSVNDTNGTAEAFDWNGIEIVGIGSAMLAHVRVSSATSGISAEKPWGITLEECIFENNLQWHLSIAGEIQNVPEGKPYSHKSQTITTTVEPEPSAPAPEAFPPPSAKKKSSKPRVLQWTLGSVGTAAAAGGAYFLYSAGQTAKEYNAYRPDTPKFDNATEAQREEHFGKLRDEHKLYQSLGWSLVGLSAASLVCLVITF